MAPTTHTKPAVTERVLCGSYGARFAPTQNQPLRSAFCVAPTTHTKRDDVASSNCEVVTSPFEPLRRYHHRWYRYRGPNGQTHYLPVSGLGYLVPTAHQNVRHNARALCLTWF